MTPLSYGAVQQRASVLELSRHCQPIQSPVSKQDHLESLRRAREEPQPGSARLLWKLLEKQAWSKEISGCLFLNRPAHRSFQAQGESATLLGPMGSPNSRPGAEMCCAPLLGRDGEEERNFQHPGNGGRIR